MNTQQEIAQALRDLEPEEAMTIVTNWLSEHDIVRKLWVPDDIRGHLADILKEDGETLSDEEISGIVERAQDSYYWRALGDCTEGDWELVSMAINEARN